MLIVFANLLMFVESVSDRSGQCMPLNSKTGALLSYIKYHHAIDTRSAENVVSAYIQQDAEPVK